MGNVQGAPNRVSSILDITEENVKLKLLRIPKGAGDALQPVGSASDLIHRSNPIFYSGRPKGHPPQCPRHSETSKTLDQLMSPQAHAHSNSQCLKHPYLRLSWT